MLSFRNGYGDRALDPWIAKPLDISVFEWTKSRENGEVALIAELCIFCRCGLEFGGWNELWGMKGY